RRSVPAAARRDGGRWPSASRRRRSRIKAVCIRLRWSSEVPRSVSYWLGRSIESPDLNALDLISTVTQLIYVLIFISVAWRAVRRPTRAHGDMTLFFGAVAFLILASRAAALMGNAPPWLTTVEIAVLMALPYVLLRLVDDFTHVRSAIKRGAELGLAAGVIATYATAPALPTPVILYVVIY